MNLYGDRGNMLALVRRSHARGIDVEVVELGPGEKIPSEGFDLLFAGGAQDREQRRVAEDLRSTKGEAIREAVEQGSVVLAVCGAYQLFGRSYRESAGEQLEGLGLFDIWTEHPGADAKRLIGNVVAEWEGGTLVGFENHGGRTYLADGAEPLARVRSGSGNNGRDRTEGARYKHAFGTYLHGSLLPKNPRFTDHLLQLALRRTHGDVELEPLDDTLENNAHAAALQLPR
jgi:CobQ-like glutamine amidotransferase family enzyme